MKTCINILICSVLLFSGLIFGKAVTTLYEINKPLSILVEKDKIFVAEKEMIYIYSNPDYKFIKKFGGKGEGPGKFNLISSMISYQDKLMINSLGKISFYTKDGVIIDEKKLNTGLSIRGMNMYPLKNGFVGNGTIISNKSVFHTINLYDSKLKKKKELSRMEGRSGNKLKILSKSFFYQTYKNRIYISSENGLSIDVLDNKGDKIRRIFFPNYIKKKFNRKEIMEKLKKKNKTKYEMLKNRIEFPKFYPEILSFFISDEVVYIATWKWTNQRIEFFIFKDNGQFIKKVFVSLKFQDELFPRPYPALTIYKQNVYQIVENEEKEEWELHKTLIK